MTKEEKSALINQIFSPAAPINNFDLFVGRTQQIYKIKETIEERGQHIVMFGGRGVGKTSLANIIDQVFQNVIVSKVTCNRADNFKSIWEKAIKRIKAVAPGQKVGYNSEMVQQIIQLSLPDEENINAAHVEEIFEILQDEIICVFDEFDNIEDEDTRMKMADTIKTLSDNLPNVTILIVGIANNVTDLIGEHPSLERCLVQIKVPLMTATEAMGIINNLEFVELEIEPDVSRKIIEYASGFPNYIHSLCKYASKSAIAGEKNSINAFHFDWAVEQSIENSNHSIRNVYEIAVKSRKKSQFEDVIFACSLVNIDDSNSFSTDEVLNVFNSITKKNVKKESINVNLGLLCKEEKGQILEKSGKEESAYKFKNPLMKAYVKLQYHNRQQLV